ncbi:PLC-like phosphodiesterase [Gorgonomyces haynaldii]|nr:PLC-like phosphodiesterase [Gorgonomyces haynaldii]
MILTLLTLAQCLPQGNQNWMRDLSQSIGDKHLNAIDIPGAHHAGFLSVPWYVAIASIWSKCQSLTITQLLDQGNRYLDLRIGEKDNTIYFTHTVQSKQLLKDGLQEINQWIKAHPGEVLILDIVKDSDFKSNSNSQTEKLLGDLKQLFGDMIMSLDDYKTKTYLELVQSNKRIALVGDFNGLPRVSSWSQTQSGNWGTVVDNVANWIPKQGKQAIQDGSIAVSSAAVSPQVGKDISPPEKVTKQTHAALRDRLPQIKERLGVIEMDFVETDTVNVIVQHNL